MSQMAVSLRPPGRRGPREDTVPVAQQEEEGGQRDGQLEPAPVRDRVGQPGEQHEPHRERHLVEDRHRPSVAQAHELCD